MNSSDQAQKGFKTFILTLSMSLIVFSVVYYLISNSSAPEDLNANIDSAVSYEVEKDSAQVFGDLADKQANESQKAVLAGTTSSDTETTQSTTPVPDSGMFGVTVGLFTSLLVFATGLFIIYKDPRKLALATFEKKILEDL